ncbi:hypothetical protein CDJ58_03820 [Campylobacter lari]|nr:hypothetical protein [Campylobacter lari]EAK5748527.1 hypothetical protein [Campylobacter lari]
MRYFKFKRNFIAVLSEYKHNYHYGLLVIDSSRNVIVAKHSKVLKAKKELSKEFLFKTLSRITNENITLMEKRY